MMLYFQRNFVYSYINTPLYDYLYKVISTQIIHCISYVNLHEDITIRQVIRDVSDEDGLVGLYQLTPHELSGKKVVDANKLALQVQKRETRHSEP